MKREYVYTLVLVVLMMTTCFAQRPTVQRNNTLKQDAKVSSEVKEKMVTLPDKVSPDVMGNVQKSDETISREMIREVSAKVKEHIANGQINEANAVIRSNMVKCRNLKNSTLCEAGLNFHSGYLLQQASKLDSINKKRFQERAIDQYEKVLDAYPDNKAALNNLIKLNTAVDNNQASVRHVMAFVEQMPSETVNYFIKMGNLFRDDGKFDLACDFYRRAYQKDPRSERACDAMITLYTKYNYTCTMAGDIREFALDCKVIGLPNYSEELLRNELTLAVKDKKESKALGSMVLWANVLAENGWLFSKEITRSINQLFPKNAVLSDSDMRVKNALRELEFIAQAENANAMNDLEFWNNFGPDVSISGDWEWVTPLHVLLKIYYAKGEQAYFNNDYSTAESFWQTALERAQNFDNAFFTVVASDLAKLYHSKPEMDPGDSKLDALVVELFNMKGAAYRANDLRMIRNYHITLGAIFYDKKKWDGGFATNAKFQLTRALSNRFGPIVNPKLQKMLGDVHSNIGETKAAIDAYGQSILDYLSLDRIQEADKLYNQTKGTMSLNDTQTKKFEAVGTVINWRKDMASPNNTFLQKTTSLNTYLNNASKAEAKIEEHLPKDFVKVQFFKGLSDLGSQLKDGRAQEQQIIYANALNKVKDGKDLSSEQDYYRVVEVNNSLMQSLEQPKKVETMKMFTKGDLTYDPEESRTGYTVYRIPTLNKEVMVPKQLFILNDTLQANYKKATTRDLAKYKLNKGRFELRQKDNN